jgi:hypothetical protein
MALALACGSRTGLIVDEPPEEAAAGDAAIADVSPLPEADATREANSADAADAAHDAAHEADAGREAEADAPHDAAFRDVPAIDLCPDAGATLVYVLTEDSALYSFYPPTLAFSEIGVIACRGGGSSSPFSMAVDRRGIAYSVFANGDLFRIDTASAACQPTPFLPNQAGFTTFGMGYTANTGDAGETLFVAEATVSGLTNKPNSKGLATVDTTSYALTFVAPFAPTIPGPELTGTSDGRLYAFFTNASGSGSHIVEVDKTTGAILADNALTVGTPADAYAFAFWGGEFWVFTSPGTTSQVTRFDPATKTETLAANFGHVIVGAGVSTCAPQ